VATVVVVEATSGVDCGFLFHSHDFAAVNDGCLVQAYLIHRYWANYAHPDK